MDEPRSTDLLRTFAEAATVDIPVGASDARITAATDSYAQRGAILSRDAAHLAIAALRRDAHEHRDRADACERAGTPADTVALLRQEASTLDALAVNIGRALR